MFLPSLCTAGRCDPNDVRECLSEFETQFLASDAADYAAQCELIITQGSLCFDGCPKSALDQFVSTYANGVCQKADAQSSMTSDAQMLVAKVSSEPIQPLGDSKHATTSHSDLHTVPASEPTEPASSTTDQSRPSETRGRLSRLMESWWRSKPEPEQDLVDTKVDAKVDAKVDTKVDTKRDAQTEAAREKLEQWGKSKAAKYSLFANSIKTAILSSNSSHSSARNIYTSDDKTLLEPVGNYTGRTLVPHLYHKGTDSKNGSDPTASVDASPITTVANTMATLCLLIAALVLA